LEQPANAAGTSEPGELEAVVGEAQLEHAEEERSGRDDDALIIFSQTNESARGGDMC
jgi:hypothetical protein